MATRGANATIGTAGNVFRRYAKNARRDGRIAFFGVALIVLLLSLAMAWISVSQAQAADVFLPDYQIEVKK